MNSLRSHRCKPKMTNNEINDIKQEVIEVKSLLKEIINKPTTIQNNTINQSNNTYNNLNVNLNCLMDCSGKPIEYLLNDEKITEIVYSWMKTKTGLLDYIDEKFYNPAHPENHLIKKGKDKDRYYI